MIFKKDHDLITEYEEFKESIFNTFTRPISYGTATAYISVACLIANFPALMKCSLSFEQLRSQGIRIHSCLEAHPEFEINESCDMAFNTTVMSIAADLYAPLISYRAPQHAYFQLIVAEDEQEEDFPCF